MLIPTSSVSDKYQAVVPLVVRTGLGLSQGDRLTWQLKKTPAGPVALVRPKPKNWAAHLKGLGKGLWKGEDAQEYVNKIRDEWEERKF